jgi:hypothetical protein
LNKQHDNLKILYINSVKNDFLADSFLIGLKSHFGAQVFEYPANKFIYKSEETNVETMHGIGFTLYGLFNSHECKEFDFSFDIDEFDLIIFGDIYRQSDLYLKWYKKLTKNQTIILDGEDTPAIWPYYRAPWKKPYSISYPKPHKLFHYFKREIIARRTNYYRFYKFIPKFITGFLPLPRIHEISFSIPEKKIHTSIVEKTKLFGKHIVDEEVSKNIEGSVTKYAFNNEKDYYEDLRKSKFGITTKRGGWDCLRHYEIAANGAVICFRNLDQKPESCAPHGLIDGFNSISYSNYSNLMNKLKAIDETDYKRIQENSLEWVKSKTCENIVIQTIQAHFDLCK